MDNLNEDFNVDFTENLNETKRQASGCLRRFSKSIKVVVIAFLILLLLIPMFMIEDMIRERGQIQTDAIEEVGQKWSLAQTITGPYINLQYPITQEDNGVKKITMGSVLRFARIAIGSPGIFDSGGAGHRVRRRIRRSPYERFGA